MSKGVGYEGVISIHVLSEWQRNQITSVKTRKVHFCNWHVSCQSAHKFQFCGWLEKRVFEAVVKLQSLLGHHNLFCWKGTLQFKLLMLNQPTEAQMVPCHGSTVNSMSGTIYSYLLYMMLCNWNHLLQGGNPDLLIGLENQDNILPLVWCNAKRMDSSTSVPQTSCWYHETE